MKARVSAAVAEQVECAIARGEPLQRIADKLGLGILTVRAVRAAMDAAADDRESEYARARGWRR